MKYLFALIFASAAFGQTYEIGAAIGYGFYQNGTIFSAAGTARSGIRNRFGAAVELGYEFSNYVSADFSYLYHDGHPFLQAPGVKTDIQGQSHALTVEALFHFKPRNRRLRPFIAGGLGSKDYVIAGPEPFPQPIPQIATLTTNDVWKLDSPRRRSAVPAPSACAAAGGVSGLHNDVPEDAASSGSAQYGSGHLPAVHSIIRRQLHVLKGPLDAIRFTQPYVLGFLAYCAGDFYDS